MYLILASSHLVSQITQQLSESLYSSSSGKCRGGGKSHLTKFKMEWGKQLYAITLVTNIRKQEIIVVAIEFKK